MNVFEPSVSDAAVQAKTGKDWQTWFAILDAAGARQMSHKEIVAFLVKEYQVSPWWQQMVAVTYEQARGLRQQHEKPDGYQISRSKTISATAGNLYELWVDETHRRRWLGEAELAVSSTTPGKVIHAAWEGGPSRVDIAFTKKGSEKTQVVVQHNRLPDAQSAEEMKAFWAAALIRLEQYQARA